MDTSSGWVKLHRRLLDNPVMEDAVVLKVWIAVLLKATHRQRRTLHGKPLQPGQFFTTSADFSEELKLGRQQVRRALRVLKELEQIETEPTSKGTRISVCNWKSYQDEEAGSQPASNQQETSKKPTEQSGAFLTRKKRIKETTKGARPVPPYASAEFSAAWRDFQEHRRRLRKPMTARAESLIFGKLRKFGSEADAIRALDASIANGWSGVFPPDEKTKTHNGSHNLDFLDKFGESQ